MKRSTKFALAAVAALGAATVAVPVIAQQNQMPHGESMGGGIGMMNAHDGMTGGMTGGAMGLMMDMMMGGAQSHPMAMFDTDSDGTLSPEEMTAGLQAELTTYDTDANGALSLEEFAVMHAAHTRQIMVRAFQMHDADGDAQVTEAEIAAMAAMMQSRMGGQQRGVQGMDQDMMDHD